MELLIGLDPGGNGRFGWCVAQNAADLPLPVVAKGLANDAESAIVAAFAAVAKDARIVAAGIDAPLFWSQNGSRAVDATVRAAVRKAGAPHAAGTVQDVNSLRGACLVQGMLAALKLREAYPTLPITEAHPKALLWLLPHLKNLDGPSEHERDALLAAIAAWATHHKPPAWHDLLLTEGHPYTPVAHPLHYYMPRSAV